MSKQKKFNVGDKIFAKVKGYPPWPAIIEEEIIKARKYKVKFYGTAEIGQIKAEDISYYLKNKEKFTKTLKRKDYLDALEEIEEAVAETGTDGNNEENSESSLAELNSSNSQKKAVKRKRSSSAKSEDDKVKKIILLQKQKANESGKESNGETKILDEVKIPLKKTGSDKLLKNEKQSESLVQVADKKTVAKEKQQTISEEKEKLVAEAKEETVVEEKKESVVEEEKETIVEEKKENDNSVKNIMKENDTHEENDTKNCSPKKDSEELELELPIDKDLENLINNIVSVEELNGYIEYAKYVEKHKEIYNKIPPEPRTESLEQFLPIILTNGKICSIKLHKEWPLKFENEYDRIVYDKTVAEIVLAKKEELSNDVTKSDAFISNLDLSKEDIELAIEKKILKIKTNALKQLQVEKEFLELDAKIKSNLGFDEKAKPAEAIKLFKSMKNLKITELMLKKHVHVVDTIRRLRKYMGNVEGWNLDNKALEKFQTEAKELREVAEEFYERIKSIIKVSEEAVTFWDGYNEVVNKFRDNTKGLSESQYNMMCTEPFSRECFVNHYIVSMKKPDQVKDDDDKNMTKN